MTAHPSDQNRSTPTVWKFAIPFPGPDVIEIDMPQHAQVLTLQVQNGRPRIWALVDPGFPRTTRTFRIAGTGHSISERIVAHVGTFQVNDSWADLVFHVFEVAP